MNPPPLGLYIHWPFCRTRCPYCDFNSHVADNIDVKRWQQGLLTEMDYLAAMVPPPALIKHLFRRWHPLPDARRYSRCPDRTRPPALENQPRGRNHPGGQPHIITN